MLAVQVKFFNSVVFASGGKCIERDPERFFLRIARCVSPEPEAHRIDYIAHCSVIEFKNCMKLPVAFRIIVDPVEGVRVDCNIYPWHCRVCLLYTSDAADE